MKKYLILFLCSLSVLLAGCTPRVAVIDSSTTTTLDGDDTIATDSLGLSVVTSALRGYEASSSIGNEAGFYNMSENNILYTDYETASRLHLCSTPNCEHDDDSCTSFYNGHGVLFLSNTGESLFYLGSNSSVTEFESDEEYMQANRDLLYRMELSGSGRELICDFGTDKDYSGGHIIAGENALYISYYTYEQEQHKSYIGMLDLTANSLTPIIELSEGEYIVSAYGNFILTEKGGDIYAHDILTGDKATVFQYSLQEKMLAFNAEYIYSYNFISGELNAINLTTNEENNIATLASGAEQSYIRHVYEDYIEVFARVGDDMTKHIINSLNSEIYTPELMMQRDWTPDGPIHIAIDAANSEYILTSAVSEEREIVAYDPGGVPYTTTAPVDLPVLISWEDYLSSVPNYISIEELNSYTPSL